MNKFYVSALKCLLKIANEIVYLSNVNYHFHTSVCTNPDRCFQHFVDNAVEVFNNYLHFRIQKNFEFWASVGGDSENKDAKKNSNLAHTATHMP